MGQKPMSDSENMSSDMEEASTNLFSTPLPETSREQYEKAYERLVEWCNTRNLKNESNEKVLLHYFETKSKSYKPSSLWSHYSMLRAMICRKRNVDISKYHHLVALLKKKSKGYKPQKSKILTKNDIKRFLQEANDERYLLLKVALIIGLSGACRRDELTSLRWENVKVEGTVLHIAIPTRKVKKARNFFITSGSIDGVNMVEIVRKYMSLRPKHADHGRFFVGYRYGNCTKQPVGINTFGSMPRAIASFLKLANPEGYTGNCFRRSSKSLFDDCRLEDPLGHSFKRSKSLFEEIRIDESQGFIDSLVEIKEEQL